MLNLCILTNSTFKLTYFRHVSENVLCRCEQTVDKVVDNMVTNGVIYAHKPQTILNKVLNLKVNPILYSYYKQFLHTFFAQFKSVNKQLFAVSTGPTITTTIIK